MALWTEEFNTANCMRRERCVCTHHENIFRSDFTTNGFVKLFTAPTVAQCNSDGSLGIILSNNETIQSVDNNTSCVSNQQKVSRENRGMSKRYYKLFLGEQGYLGRHLIRNDEKRGTQMSTGKGERIKVDTMPVGIGKDFSWRGGGTYD